MWSSCGGLFNRSANGIDWLDRREETWQNTAYGKIWRCRGPVGLTVFKTAEGRSARSSVGSTPICLCLFLLFPALRGVILPIGFAESARLCFLFVPNSSEQAADLRRGDTVAPASRSRRSGPYVSLLPNVSRSLGVPVSRLSQHCDRVPSRAGGIIKVMRSIYGVNMSTSYSCSNGLRSSDKEFRWNSHFGDVGKRRCGPA